MTSTQWRQDPHPTKPALPLKRGACTIPELHLHPTEDSGKTPILDRALGLALPGRVLQLEGWPRSAHRKIYSRPPRHLAQPLRLYCIPPCLSALFNSRAPITCAWPAASAGDTGGRGYLTDRCWESSCPAAIGRKRGDRGKREEGLQMKRDGGKRLPRGYAFPASASRSGHRPQPPQSEGGLLSTARRGDVTCQPGLQIYGGRGVLPAQAVCTRSRSRFGCISKPSAWCLSEQRGCSPLLQGWCI